MSNKLHHQAPSTFKAALDRLTGGSLAAFEYLLAVGTIAVLLLNMQTGMSTLAAIIAATLISIPLLVAIHFWMAWEKGSKSRKDAP